MTTLLGRGVLSWVFEVWLWPSGAAGRLERERESGETA